MKFWIPAEPFYRSFRTEKNKQQKSGYKQLQNDSTGERERPRSAGPGGSPNPPRGSPTFSRGTKQRSSGPPRPPKPKVPGVVEALSGNSWSDRFVQAPRP